MAHHANTLRILYTDGAVLIRTYDELDDLMRDIKRLAQDIMVKAYVMYYQAPV